MSTAMCTTPRGCINFDDHLTAVYALNAMRPYALLFFVLALQLCAVPMASTDIVKNAARELKHESTAEDVEYADLSNGFASFNSEGDKMAAEMFNPHGKNLHANNLQSSEVDDDPNAACAPEDYPKLDDWITQGGIVVVILGMLVSFWGLALVCDHYFCAALIIMCEETKIPEDVAGATVMAIGTSAADVMISVISLFVQQSTLGLGTIIGITRVYTISCDISFIFVN